MGGGLMQLVAYGAQDIYLTGNPQITFFKVVYRRHTNFAMESIEQTFNGAVGFDRRVTATISRNGDLIKDMWLEVFVSSDTSSKYGVGNVLVKQVEVEIGGQLIDRQYGEWMDIWSELSVPEGKRLGYDTLVGNKFTSESNQKLDVPLMFWFNRNPGLALPLIALQYHEVKINLDIATKADCFGSATEPTLALKLWVDYIYLDTDERRRFAQVSHEYLIEQLQFTGDASMSSGATSFRTELNFNHPCKELIWVYQTSAQARGVGNGSTPCQFSSLEVDTQSNGPSAILKLNGQDRFQERRMEYFRRVQGFKHHTHSVRTTQLVKTGENMTYSQYIYLYSFALNPEEHQPSGTCNFSRIDNTILSFSNLGYLTTSQGAPTGAAAGIVKVFAVNYNVLRIMSGMGGLAYSN
jgi:hypothetical protein